MQYRFLAAAALCAICFATTSSAADPKNAVAPKTTATDPFKGLSKQHDAMTAITWYQAPGAPKRRNNPGVYLYFGKEDSGTILPMHLDMQYVGETWLFVTRAWARADGVEVTPPQVSKGVFGWERDNGYGFIAEWSDATVTEPGEIAVVRKLIEAKSVTIRYEGKQYRDDKALTAAQQKAMRDTVAAYEAATGKPWK